MKYDLHCHSNFSDGDLSPDAVIALAEQQGITHLALTDHDTMEGLAEAKQAADLNSITLVNGIEFSCSWEGQLLHVLGLDIDPNNLDLQKLTMQNQQRRLDRAEQMHVDFEKHDMDLRKLVTAQLTDRGVPTRPHFAQALIESGYAKNKNQAFKRYLVPGKPGYIPMQWPELDQIANAIASSNGVAVLAHPLRYKFTRTRLIKLIEAMLEVGIRGIEVSTPVTDSAQQSMLERLALQYNLLASIGSDFHSLEQSWARLGSATDLPSSLVPVWTEFH